MRLLALSVSVLVLGVVPAHAAFEFVSPQAAPAQSVEAEPMPMPEVAPVVPAIDAHAVVSSDLAPPPAVPAPVMDTPAALPAPVAMKAAPMPLAPSKPVTDPIPLTPVVHDTDALIMEPTLPVLPANLTRPSMPMASVEDHGAVVQGFGRDVPLVLALQQIVPANYRYSFDPGINPGMRVSWTGGQPWKNVVSELAQSHNMNADIVSNVVAFRKNDAADFDAPMPASVAAPMPIAVADEPYMPGDPKPLRAPEGMQPLQPVVTMPHNTGMREQLAQARRDAAGLPKPAPAAPVKPVIAASDTSFDPLMDSDRPAMHRVKEKRILVADNTSVAMNAPAPSTQNLAQDIAMQPLLPEMPALPSAPVASQPMDAPLPMHVPDMGMMVGSAHDQAAMMGMPAATSRVTDLAAPSEWYARKGMTLRQVLTDWSNAAGVSLVWSSEYDYPLQTDVRIAAGYADAVKTLLAGFSKAQPRPLGRLFSNSDVGASAVLMIQTQRLSD